MQAINNIGSLWLLGSRRMGFIWKGEIYYSVFHINVLEGTSRSDLYFILGMEAALGTCPGAPRAGASTRSAPGAPLPCRQQGSMPELHTALQRGDHTLRGTLSLLVSEVIRCIFLSQLNKQHCSVCNEFG